MSSFCFPPPENFQLSFHRYSVALSFFRIVFTAIVSLPTHGFAQEIQSFESLQAQFEKTQQTVLNKYCLSCHSAAENQGELDLEQFRSLEGIRGNVVPWQRVVEMLQDGEMPPKDAKNQPTAAEISSLKNWVQAILHADSIANAGDPGPVVLRRLNNTEFTYTIQDLTRVKLNPAREFPADSAAGEGFTNVGSALVISPALIQKYLDAAKEISSHAMLVPTGIQFSENTTQRDWTNEKLAAIQKFYARFSDNGGATAVNLQGIQFDTNNGGRLPLESYLRATLMERDALRSGRTTIARVAKANSLNEKYLNALWTTLNDQTPSLVLDVIRAKWRTAKPDELADLVSTIAKWQQSLWRFATIGHIGKRDGPTAWQVPIQPLSARHEIRSKLVKPNDGKDLTLFLVASDLSDGNESDFAVWENPRFVAAGKPDLHLRDLRYAIEALSANRERILSNAATSLAAASEYGQSAEKVSIGKLAEKFSVDQTILASWFQYLGIGAREKQIESYMTTKMERAENYDFVKGWVGPDALSLIANSSDQFVRIPGDMQPHSVGVHPSPKKRVAVGWRSPIAGSVSVSSRVQRAHIGCGNGVTWLLEHSHQGSRRILASGSATNSEPQQFASAAEIAIEKGDLISLIIGPRDGEHSCDMTAIDISIRSSADSSLDWDLAKDVSPDILAGNPHADRQGNSGVWHFYNEPDSADEKSIVPVGSLLEKWQLASDLVEMKKWADEIQTLLNGGTGATPENSPDAMLYRQLTSLSGPLFSAVRAELLANKPLNMNPNESKFGVDPSLFGNHPNGQSTSNANMVVQAPSLIEVIVPADLVEGYEFVATGALHPETGAEGTVQLQVLFERPSQLHGLSASGTAVKGAKSTWSDGDRPLQYDSPIIAAEGSESRKRIQAQFDAFRSLFPAALCYTKIVPVDEVVTLTLFYREDDHLKRLMLDDEQTAELDQLWDELHFVSQDALALVDAYEQLWQFATQDADPSAFTPMREGIMQRAEQFKSRMLETEPIHIQSMLDFAEQAWRRPLSQSDKQHLMELYQRLRSEELPHGTAIRMLLARVLVAPAFLFRSEEAAPGKTSTRVTSQELATRLSYFLWSTMPDRELQGVAASGTLHDPDVMRSQVRRMMSDNRMRRMAIEFGCQWLHIRDFDQLDEKSEKHYPEFAGLKSDMYEESIRFFENMFRNDGSILDLLSADHTYLNGRLAKFYGIDNVEGDWQKVDGMRKLSRGGILSMAATMAKHSGASRTSPILRGNWVSEFLLGEKLPRPPKNVPVLPEDVPADLTERQLIERHSNDPACAKCHQRIDGFGYALEQYDTIGRLRTVDAHGLRIDTASVLRDGTRITGVEGLQEYLSTTRRKDFLETFCRRLLGYALGRSVQLSDKPLIDEMLQQLSEKDYRISVAVELIVLSPQFRMIRGAEHGP